jgi:hypothetical protein
VHRRAVKLVVSSGDDGATHVWNGTEADRGRGKDAVQDNGSTHDVV